MACLTSISLNPFPKLPIHLIVDRIISIKTTVSRIAIEITTIMLEKNVLFDSLDSLKYSIIRNNLYNSLNILKHKTNIVHFNFSLFNYININYSHSH
jgi:hypothetical protein